MITINEPNWYFSARPIQLANQAESGDDIIVFALGAVQAAGSSDQVIACGGQLVAEFIPGTSDREIILFAKINRGKIIVPILESGLI